jgi:THO complex subunit 5
MDLLKQNRLILDETKNVKQKESELMQEMDQSYLLLQNYKYKIQHLQREIQRIEQQETLYSEIDLYPIEQFKELQPDKIVEDSHQLMINRLQFELQERKRVLEELAQEQENRDELEKKLKERQARLELLQSKIRKVIETSKEMESVFEE